MNFVPSFSAVGTFVQSTSFSARLKEIGVAAKLQSSGVKYIWVIGVNGDVGTACIFVYEEDFVPSLAAVGCFVQSSVGVCIPQMTQCCGIDGI